MTKGHHRKVPIDIGTAGLSVLRVHRLLWLFRLGSAALQST